MLFLIPYRLIKIERLNYNLMQLTALIHLINVSKEFYGKDRV